MRRKKLHWQLLAAKGLMHFQASVYIIFVYRVTVYVDMSTRSSQINHLSPSSAEHLVCLEQVKRT